MDPFAKALQSSSKTQSTGNTQNLSPEIETNLNSPTKSGSQSENPFAQAMANAGGVKSGENTSAQNLEKQREEQKKQLEKEQKKKALRLKLHKEVTGATDIFSTERIKTQKKLEEIRKSIEVEFLGLGKEISKLHSETRKTTFVTITDQGLTGTGMISYLEKIRQFIRLLRKKIHSARTWAQTQNRKSKKKRARRKGGAGIEVGGGAKHEQTKAVFDQMHHEQSTVYSGS